MKALALLVLVASSTLFVSCAGAPRDVTDPAAHPVFYNLQCTIRAGQEQSFRQLMAEMVASTKDEPGTLVYEWFLAADGKTCHIHELFADTAAYKAHGDNFGARFADRFMPCIEVTGFTVYGNADGEARELLGTLNPAYFAAIGGFRR